METDFTARYEAIASRIKELRIKGGYTSYKKFALAHSLENKSVWRWENAEGGYSMKTIFTIIDIHGISAEEFFKDIT